MTVEFANIPPPSARQVPPSLKLRRYTVAGMTKKVGGDKLRRESINNEIIIPTNTPPPSARQARGE